MPLLVLILAIAALVISIATAIAVFAILSGIRRQSKKSYEVASRVMEDWEKFSAREADERQRLAERFARFEKATSDRVEQFEKVATGTRERLIKLEQYLKEFFEVELKSVFDSFDKTVSSILEEMKSELLRGIERIEDIQAFVDSKSMAQDRILDGEGSVYRMLNDTATKTPAAASAPEASEPLVRYANDEEKSAEPPEKPPYRLEADEAE
ncbi:MAG: hypothetical protein ACLQVA_10435 [Candidatus Brocadiia bacterium]